MSGEKEYEVNVWMIAKVDTKHQGCFFVRIHDGYKINAIIKKIKTTCDIEELKFENIEIIEPSEMVLKHFNYDEVWCATGDVLLIYKNGDIIGVERATN